MEQIIKVKSSLYPKEAVMKAAYHFLDRCYIHMDFADGEYVISLSSKTNEIDDHITYEFENELLSQTVRYQVYQQTHMLREILMARAMSSTITGSNTVLNSAELPDQVDNLENILMDWFEKNEK